jgi:citronellol/citronellal dehydrogenase
MTIYVVKKLLTSAIASGLFQGKASRRESGRFLVPRWTTQLCYDRLMVTGGGSGIGRGVALETAGTGATVYVLGRTDRTLRETAALASGARVVPHVCDIRDPAAVNQAFAAVEADGGPVQAVVHCAASVQYAPAHEITADAFAQVVNSTLLGSFNVLSRWGGALIRGGLDGVAVALTSAIASRGTPGVSHSAAGKAGTEALVKSLAREWGPNGIRLNAVGPGFFPVERTQAMFEGEMAGKNIIEQIALGRLGELDEIVGPIVLLLTRAARYVTGQVLIPDGGFRLTPDVLPRWEFNESTEPAKPLPEAVS